MYAVMLVIGLLPLLVSIQMIRIVVTQGEALSEAGERQASTQVTVPAQRGAILDRNGRPLVINAASYNLALDPTVSGFSGASEQLFFETLSTVTGKSEDYYRQLVASRSSRQYVLLERDLDEESHETLSAIEVPGVLLVRTFTRRSNFNHLGAHVLGYLSSDGRGIEGLEEQFDDVLSGVAGSRAVQRDRHGNIKAYVAGQTKAPRDGQNLVLTLDMTLQTIVEDELIRRFEETKARWATAVAMNPFTGEILAMANAPSFDPNNYSNYPVSARRNRAITDQVEPGSTFKLVSAIAAIESGVVAMEDSIETGNGYAVVAGRGLQDLHGYGTITFARAIEKSSNIGIGKIATRLDPGVFFQHARNLGFGQKTMIELPGEASGTLKKPHEWSGTSLTSMSIGYEIDATPLQILTAYSALANGGLVIKPYIVKERVSPKGEVLYRVRADSIRRAFTRETRDKLLPAFENVVEGGTAHLAGVENLRIAGKTGTARVLKNGIYSKDDHRATLVGFFPAEKPQVALLVMVAEPDESANSGVITAPLFKRIVQRWAGASPEMRTYLAETEQVSRPAPDPIEPPSVVGKPAHAAAEMLLASGYQVTKPGEEERLKRVVQQVFSSERQQKPGARIKLELEERPAVPVDSTMPDLTGFSIRKAVHLLHAHDVQVRVEGMGMVVSQTPAPGEPVTEIAVLRCR